MTEQQPITPPDELVEQWIYDGPPLDQPKFVAHYIATQAARWGDEQRLAACFEWLRAHQFNVVACELRAAMRPKPPSLAEQAKQELAAVRMNVNHWGYQCDTPIINRALNRLAELENHD